MSNEAPGAGSDYIARDRIVITVFIDSMAVPLPRLTAAGDVVTPEAADILNDVLHKRIKAQVRYMLIRSEIDADSIQQKVDELAKQELVPYSAFDNGEEEDFNPILDEAVSIAYETGKNLNDPEVKEKARKRVEARYRAAEEMMGER